MGKVGLLVVVLTASLGVQATAAESGAKAVEPAAAPQTTVDATRGGVTITSGHNSLTIGARVQFRATVDDREQFDADLAGAGLGVADGIMSEFDVPRLRLSMSGGVFAPWMKYSLQFEMSRTSGEADSKIKDAILAIQPPGHAYRFQVGQDKAPFGLQQLTSSGRLQFVDRAITDAKFNPGRDLGVMFGGGAAQRRVGYSLGVFNGAGESRRQNNEGRLWVGRVFANPFGEYRLAEGASDAPASPVLHLGLSGRSGKQIRGRTASGVFENPDNQRAVNFEFAFKAARFFTTAEYFWMTEEQTNPVPGPDIDSHGFHAQAGYMLIPRNLEVAVLFAQIDGDRNLDDSNLNEIRGALSYYFRSHNLKVQGDIGQLRFDPNYAALSGRARLGLPGLGTRLVSGESLSDTQFRLQLQVAF
jgi:phosphate-selective porin OprO and OprP